MNVSFLPFEYEKLRAVILLQIFIFTTAFAQTITQIQPDTTDALFGQSNQQQRRAVPYRRVSEGQCSALLLWTQAHAHIQDDSPVTNSRLDIFSQSVVVKLMRQPTGRAPGDAAVWGEEWRDQTVEISDRIGARM